MTQNSKNASSVEVRLDTIVGGQKHSAPSVYIVY